MTWKRRRISSSLEHVRRRPVWVFHGCQGRRRPRPPAELADVFGQVTQDDFLAANGGAFKVAAVEEILDGFLDDRAVRVAFPAAVLGELAQHPLLARVSEPARVAGRDQRVDQAAQRQRAHDRAPLRCGKNIFDVQAQPRRCSVSSLR